MSGWSFEAAVVDQQVYEGLVALTVDLSYSPGNGGAARRARSDAYALAGTLRKRWRPERLIRVLDCSWLHSWVLVVVPEADAEATRLDLEKVLAEL